MTQQSETGRSKRKHLASLLPVYARKEPTTDSFARNAGLKNKLDTVIYRDEQCTKVFVRYFWYRSDAPRRSKSRITLNCFNWNLFWLDDASLLNGGRA